MEFQQTVGQYLIRHRSILDVLSKFQESNSRVNRAVAKSVTSCGCLTVQANRQPVTSTMSLDDFRKQADSHLQGELCEHCKDILENEVGANLFYLAALCNILGLELSEIMTREKDRINTLGVFNLS